MLLENKLTERNHRTWTGSTQYKNDKNWPWNSACKRASIKSSIRLDSLLYLCKMFSTITAHGAFNWSKNTNTEHELFYNENSSIIQNWWATIPKDTKTHHSRVATWSKMFKQIQIWRIMWENFNKQNIENVKPHFKEKYCPAIQHLLAWN